MGEHDVTATTDVRGGSYGGVEAHIERTTDNHSNKEIDVSKKGLNSGEVLLDYEQLKEDHYGAHVMKVNKNRRGSKGKSNSKYEDVNDYLNRTDGSCDTTGVQFFGNKEIWKGLKDELLSSGLTESEITTAMDNGYSAYAEKFNQRNEFVKMVKWTSHHDETTPHWHSHLFTEGVSASGKPLKSFDSALAMQMPDIPDVKGSKSNKARMTAWRKQEDTAFFQSVSDSLVALARSKGSDLKLNFYRKDEHNGLTMSEYKAKGRIEDSLKQANDSIVGIISGKFPNGTFGNGVKLGSPEGVERMSSMALQQNINNLVSLLDGKSVNLDKRVAKQRVLVSSLKTREESLNAREEALNIREERLEKEGRELDSQIELVAKIDLEVNEKVGKLEDGLKRADMALLEASGVKRSGVIMKKKAMAIVSEVTHNPMLIKEINDFMDSERDSKLSNEVKNQMHKDIRFGKAHLDKVKAQDFDDLEL